jgi:predicted DNA-binding protein
MEEPVFWIRQKKYLGETAVISMRLPKDMLKDIDAVAGATGRTRNEIMATSLEFALRHMEIVLGEDKNN